MSGHSKWSTIKRKKALVDSKRAKVWTKILKEVQLAARTGGGDPNGNARLRLAMDRARAANVPKDTLARAVDKGSGGQDGEAWEEVVYEGYGPAGVAVVIECMTDNRNRTVGEVRALLTRAGGTLGESGSVAWIFKKRGIILVLKEAASEDKLMEAALEAGAQDIRDDGEVWTVETDPSVFLVVQDAIRNAGIEIENAEIDNVPDNRVEVPEAKAESLFKMLALLEDLDDVQNVYANYSMSDELIERYSS